MKKFKTDREFLQEIEAWLCFNNTPTQEQVLQLKHNLQDHLSNRFEKPVVPKIAEVLNQTIKDLARKKYYNLNEQPITDENWNKMIDQSESYGAYKTLLELKKKFVEIDSSFSV